MIFKPFVVEKYNELDGERWEFRLIDLSNRLEIRLTEYAIIKRETKRHKFHRVKHYDSYDKRNNTLDLSNVPMPDDVVTKARELFMDEMSKVKIIKEW